MSTDTTRADDVGAYPLDIARTCANGDGRKTLVTVHGVAYCGPCAIEAVRARNVPEVS